MMPLPRFMHTLGLSFVLVLALSLAGSQAFAQQVPVEPPPEAPDVAAPADDQAAPARAQQAPEQQFDLRAAVENYWHYGKIARYDLAEQFGQQILASGADPAEILRTFEQVAQQRRDNLDQWLLRWQATRELQNDTTQIINVLEQGRRGRGGDPQYIQQNIERLSTNERAYSIGIGRLRNSGELAIPFMLDYLRDPTKAEHHGAVRRALRDMGRYALSPLVAATEMRDWDALVTICNVLGDLGYDAAAPYLARITTDPDAPAQVKAAAAAALQRLGVRGTRGMGAADLFYDLAEKLYYDRASIAADNRLSVAYVWYWTGTGLVKLDVPPPIFNELMCMRSCEYALKLGGSQGDALSLWLAANYKREVELPEGASDPTRLPNQPDAHYYGVVTGSQYLNSALDRALRDGNAPVSMKIIASLQEIIGESNMFSGAASRPLIAAMQYPDRLVRFEAAFALAGAVPQRPFDGQDMVIPLLAEAISQTGQATVFLVMPSENQVNTLADGLRALNYTVAGATTPEAAVANAAQMPAVDVVVIAEDLGAPQVDQTLALLRQNTRLRGAARVVMTQTAASRYEAMKVNDSLLFTTTAREPQTLQSAIEDARNRSGLLAIDEQVATEYATRAGMLLLQVASSRGQVYELSAAKTALLAALTDPRPQIVMLAGNVLGLLNDRDAQAGLLQVATEQETSDDVKISLYNSLATNARFFGNQLDATQADRLQRVVAEAENLEVRSAAAEAHGAMNLPADRAKALIVDQSRVSLDDPLRPAGAAESR